MCKKLKVVLFPGLNGLFWAALYLLFSAGIEEYLNHKITNYTILVGALAFIISLELKRRTQSDGLSGVADVEKINRSAGEKFAMSRLMIVFSGLVILMALLIYINI